MKKLFLLLTIIFLSNCSIQTIENIYQDAIYDAMIPEPHEISTNLTKISPANKNLIWKTIDNEKYVLVVNWTKNITYFQTKKYPADYNTKGYDIWITAVPELIDRMKSESYSDVHIRLKQLIGLPPESDYKYFVEFWVKPEDIYRPCPDAEIDDDRCELCFSEKTDSTHISWINNCRIDSYYDCELYRKYPWTQLGYTYDWNPKNKSHFGISEFVIRQYSWVIIKKIYTTEEYLENE